MTASGFGLQRSIVDAEVDFNTVLLLLVKKLGLYIPMDAIVPIGIISNHKM
jgi:hypothetical protein